jgi:ABC-type Na+ transport system ATPase subunit NatA
MPPAAQSSGTAGSNTVEPNSDSGSDQAQSSNTSNQQARASGLPARLTAEQILNYYANLTSPYERDQVKKGIAEIDKQLTGQAQQAKQQPAK